MDNNYMNQSFLSSNYYIGITSLDIDGLSSVGNVIKDFKNNNLDFFSLSIFSFNIYSLVNSISDQEAFDKINSLIENLSKKYKTTFIFSYNISANPIGYFTVWDSKRIFKGEVQSISDIAYYLEIDNSAFLSIKKPHRGIQVLNIFPQLKDRLCGIEVSSSSYGKSSFENIYYDLLDKGWHIGALSDYNRTNKNRWYTGIICSRCYPDLIIKALRDKKSYSTKSLNLKLFFSINGVPMGDTLKIKKFDTKLSFYIYSQSKTKSLCGFEVLTNGESILKNVTTTPLSIIQYIFKDMISDKNSWFVVRVIGKDGVIAISSPVFIEK